MKIARGTRPSHRPIGSGKVGAVLQAKRGNSFENNTIFKADTSLLSQVDMGNDMTDTAKIRAGR